MSPRPAPSPSLLCSLLIHPQSSGSDGGVLGAAATA